MARAIAPSTLFAEESRSLLKQLLSRTGGCIVYKAGPLQPTRLERTSMLRGILTSLCSKELACPTE